MKSIKALNVGGVAACVAMFTVTASFADDWTGKYATEDIYGEPLMLTLMDDGKATGARQGISLTGTWKKEGDAALVKWTTGWITKLSKDGDRYTKTAYRVGTSIDEGPTHTAAANNVE